ncbi:uncharacterized protein ASPGLDRAFT_57410 [Aspergillus glaucus CBS 516.65]|uniref:Uncharacterized protein n=1 Tax=Aspergillus glaucus CBS 516.65 TaxID=1160497 RepID=A0A1L9VMY8_ASPGL|nr:hypothetical protein ASPGLDRAFT_57410 [Aspergillus glaucus CBS 516.65]OJJ85240.1 hypothetical protein ASPGLDRAFT_57410 [Aspergillus glaucus CBS 516.65]
MNFSALPDDILFAFAEKLEEEPDINVLSRSNSRLHQLLNPFLYQYNIRHHSAYERVDEPVDRRYGNNPEGEEDDDDRLPVQHPMLQIAEGFTAWLSRISAPKPKEPHIPPYRRDPRQPLVMGAASVGHVGIMEILLAHGANPDTREFCSWAWH